MEKILKYKFTKRYLMSLEISPKTPNAGNWVHLIPQKSYDVNEIFPKLKTIFEKEGVDFKNKTIFLKVSFVYPARDTNKTQAIITNPALIAATCHVLVELGAQKVFIGDGETMGPARYSYNLVGIHKQISTFPKEVRARICFAYIDELHKEWTAPANPIIPNISVDFPDLVKDVDVFISMPKLKVNIFADITLSVKNGMGLVTSATRFKYHNDNLHGLIADIYQIRPPDFVITDAIIAGEGQGPMEVTPYPLNLILCGNNGLAVDAISCSLMGYNPHEIKHLQMLWERSYGPLELKDIKCEEQDLLYSSKHVFKRPDPNLTNLSPNVHVYVGEGCQLGCPAFIRGGLDAYGFGKGWDSLGEIHIIVGKNPPISQEQLRNLPRKKTIIYGDCARDLKKYGHFLAGCAPNYLKAYLLYAHTPLGMSPSAKYVEIRTLIKTYFLHFLRTLIGKKYKSLRRKEN